MKTILICLFLFFATFAHADIDVNKLAEAIRIAEGINSNHPYGILKPYCSKDNIAQCKKGCIQTITHGLKDWNGKGSFISFLATRYCPINSDTDNGTCKNWEKNVSYYYKK